MRLGQNICNRFLSFGFVLLISTFTISCVQNSREYKELQAQLDSLQGSYGIQKNQLDDIFKELNLIEDGLEEIKKTENILTVESNEENLSLSQKEKIERNIAAIKSAIANYQKKIEELKNDGNIKSVEFKKRLNKIQSELNEKSTIIQKLSNELTVKDLIIKEKDETIAKMDDSISLLQENVDSLALEKTKMEGTIQTQEKEIHSAYYIVGTKEELISQGVLEKGGLFSKAKVSYQGEKSAFIKIDYREISTINTNSSKAEVLSVHPKETYSIDNINDEAIITIKNPEKFWEQTKYLVIQTR